MKPVSVSAVITEGPDIMAPAGPPHTYLSVAQHLVPGAVALAANPGANAMASALVCAHTLECLLKAYLSKTKGSDARLKQNKLRHNLSALWSLAATEGLLASPVAPDWAEQLSLLHNAPYYLRYSTGVNVLVLPPAEPMTSELVTLLKTVRTAVL